MEIRALLIVSLVAAHLSLPAMAGEWVIASCTNGYVDGVDATNAATYDDNGTCTLIDGSVLQKVNYMTCVQESSKFCSDTYQISRPDRERPASFPVKAWFLGLFNS